MGVSINASAPKSLVCSGTSEKNMDDLGVPCILGNLHIPILRWAMGFVNWLVTGNPMISRRSPPQVQPGAAGCCRPCHGQPQPPRKGTTTPERVVPPAALRARHGQRCQGDITWGKAGLLLPFCLGLAMWFYHLSYSCIIIVSCVHTPSHSEREREVPHDRIQLPWLVLTGVIAQVNGS